MGDPLELGLELRDLSSMHEIIGSNLSVTIVPKKKIVPWDYKFSKEKGMHHTPSSWESHFIFYFLFLIANYIIHTGPIIHGDQVNRNLRPRFFWSRSQVSSIGGCLSQIGLLYAAKLSLQVFNAFAYPGLEPETSGLSWNNPTLVDPHNWWYAQVE